MKKNIQVMIKAAIQMLHTWRRSIVCAVLLFALCLLEYFPAQWHDYEITSNIQLSLTRIVIPIVFACCVLQIISDWARDGYDWWRILGHVVGGVIGCVILILARELIWSFTCEGFLKGWACFAAATIILTVLETIVGWRVES